MELDPVRSDEVMPFFLVEKGYHPKAKPKVRIVSYAGGDSYKFIFSARLREGVPPEEVVDLFSGYGATGSPGYVQRTAQSFLKAILDGRLERELQRRREAA